MSMQGKTYKNYEEFSIAFDNTPEEVLRIETYTLLKAYNKAEQDIQQYKQQIDELKKWLEIIKYKDVNFCLNGTTQQYRVGYNEAIEEVLSKLKERDEK